MSAGLVEYHKEFYRVVATIYVTETGIFKKLPAEITSGYLEIQAIYRICTVDRAGRLRIQDFYNQPAMDENKLAGGDVYLDGAYWYTEAGSGTTSLQCETVYSILQSVDPALWDLAMFTHDMAIYQEPFTP